MNRHEKYKASKIDWIGDVPVQWQLKRIKDFFSVLSGNGFPDVEQGNETGDFPFFKVSDINGETKYVRLSNNYVDEKTIITKGWNVIPKNSIITGKIGEALKKNHRKINTVPCLVDNNLMALYPNKKIDIHFAYYLLNIIDMDWFTNPGTIPAVATTSLVASGITLPQLPEQLTISAYLDEQTQKIDKLIANKKAQVEKLKELRQIEINNAVTKGLNKNIELKESEIEWLGKIPKHWEVKRLKKFTTKIGSGVTPKGGADVYEERGIPLFRSQNIHFDGLRIDDIVYITKEVHESMSGSKVETNDVLLNITGASIGRCYFYDGSLGEANVNQHVSIIRTNSKLDYRYLQQFMSSDCGQSQIFMGQTGTSREGLTFQDIKNIFIPTPPPEEQIEITEFLKTKTTAIDKLIKNTEAQIGKLLELRKIKIYEAVTGKIKVNAYEQATA